MSQPVAQTEWSEVAHSYITLDPGAAPTPPVAGWSEVAHSFISLTPGIETPTTNWRQVGHAIISITPTGVTPTPTPTPTPAKTTPSLTPYVIIGGVAVVAIIIAMSTKRRS